jgi:D-alanine-D-alanine ligase
MTPPVLICHSNLMEDAPADELDVMDQVEWFKNGLRQLGIDSIAQPFSLGMPFLEKKGEKPALIVNLVETVNGDGRLIHLAPLLFEHFRINFTGCSSDSLYLTSNKPVAKKIMRYHGILTPDWIEVADILQYKTKKLSQYIIKSVWEHASAGMDEHEVLLYDDFELISGILKEKNEGKAGWFAEQYIPGREFNISIIETETGPRVLPVAEMQFIDYPESKPKILGYRAKWDENSFEYRNTTRCFNHWDEDRILYDNMKAISLRLWTVFNLNGYARVDFRTDENGNPFVLEINANPCISGNSGFVAATRKAGIPHHEVVRNILNSAQCRREELMF